MFILQSDEVTPSVLDAADATATESSTAAPDRMELSAVDRDGHGGGPGPGGPHDSRQDLSEDGDQVVRRLVAGEA